MTPSNFIVYALHRDDSDRVYVGKSCSGMKRPMNHRASSRGKRTPVAKWVTKHGGVYNVTVLDQCKTHDELCESEKHHIAYFRSIGMRLLNVAEGGEGTLGVKRNFSDETRRRMSVAHTGKKRSVEHVKNSAIGHRGLYRSDETRAKMSEVQRRIAQTPERRAQILAAQALSRTPEALAKLAESNRGRKFSDEHRAKLSAAHTGRKQPAELIEKRVSALRGRKRDPETCRKISETKRLRQQGVI